MGAGIIGTSLAIELNKSGLRVLVIDKGQPGRESSWAAGGMLADSLLETRPQLRELATASAKMYPEFVHELEDESRMKIDLRGNGTLVLTKSGPGLHLGPAEIEELAASYPLPQPLEQLEPALCVPNRGPGTHALFLQERSVDPRELIAATIAAGRHRGIDFSSGNQVVALELADGRACGVRTTKTRFAAGIVVNCAGAWSGEIAPFVIPTRPVKGQMLCVEMPQRELVRHVVRTPDVYLIPRSDGRMLIGASQEEAGFDKQAVPEVIQKLRAAAVALVPKLAAARILEAWAGLRPGTPDSLPILGPTAASGYFVATGHFRDGILLAPVTARVMGKMIMGKVPEFDLTAFAVDRF